MVRHHEPIEPESPEASSATNRLHVPLADDEVNVDIAVAPDGTGAGAGNESAPSVASLVGAKDPDGREVALTEGRAVGEVEVHAADRRGAADVAEEHDVLPARSDQQHVEVDRHGVRDVLQRRDHGGGSPGEPGDRDVRRVRRGLGRRQQGG